MTEEYRPGDDLPDRRRHGYKDLETKLNRHAEEIEKRFHRFFVGVLIAISIIGITSAVGLLGFGILLREESRQNQNIQDQRRTEVTVECESQNKRNQDTSAALVRLSDQDQANAPSEAARREIQRRRDVTLALIDALAPVQDCEKLAKAAVRPVED